MSDQGAFFDVPRARNRITPEGRVVRHPAPSFAAARSLSSDRISALQREIVSVLRSADPPLTDQAIVEEIRRVRGPNDSDSSIRSRRAELVRRGLVERAGWLLGTTRSGEIVTAIDPLADGLLLRVGRRENAQARAVRFLATDRVMIRCVDERGVLAHVRGDSGHVRTVIFKFGAWSCDCPARSENCAHVIAVKNVVVVRRDT